jgi:hypothetical protein
MYARCALGGGDSAAHRMRNSVIVGGGGIMGDGDEGLEGREGEALAVGGRKSGSGVGEAPRMRERERVGEW